MAARITVVDLFGLLEHRRPVIEVMDILAGRKPLIPGQSIWGFPWFHPTQGPSSGPGSVGGGGRFFSGIAGGSFPRVPPGTFIRPS